MALTKINYNQLKGAPTNVLDYGAVAGSGGVFDETIAAANKVAFQAAIDALVSGGTLYIPAGIYDLVGPLTIQQTSGLIIEGAGTATYSSNTALGTVLRFNSATNTSASSIGISITNNNDTTQTRRCVLRDFTVLGGKGSSPTNTAYLLSAIKAQGSNLFENIHTQYCAGPGMHLSSYVLDTRLKDCMSFNNGTGLRVGGVVSGSNTTVSVSNCAFKSNTAVGVNLKDVDGFHMSDSIIESNIEQGLWMNPDANSGYGSYLTNLLFTRVHFEGNALSPSNASLAHIYIDPVNTAYGPLYTEFHQCSIGDSGENKIIATGLNFLTFRDCNILMSNPAATNKLGFVTATCRHVKWINTLVDAGGVTGPLQFWTYYGVDATSGNTYAAPTWNAVLNDGVAYLQESWTPNISALTSVGTAAVVEGTYVRVARVVHCRGTIAAGSGGNTSIACAAAGGHNTITGLPYPIGGDSTGTFSDASLSIGKVMTVNAASNALFIPDFAATSNKMSFQFSYETSAPLGVP